MTPARMLVEIGEIKGLMIIVDYNPLSDQSRYRIRAESSRFSDWYNVGTWDTFEETLEEFQKWDALRMKQMEDEE